ncbi:MAG TPA: hypothetical protein VLH56_18115 [Dissulfurispiraceae bacterium]|nr:hypothetical protein [Dissulfurispiraceae bacterium]
MNIIDCHNEITSFVLLPAGSRGAGTVDGTAVDVTTYKGIIKVILNGATGGTGTLNVKMQTGDLSNGSDAADITGGAFTQITTTGGNQALAIDTRGCKKFIRATATVGTGPQVFAVLAVAQGAVI